MSSLSPRDTPSTGLESASRWQRLLYETDAGISLLPLPWPSDRHTNVIKATGIAYLVGVIEGVVGLTQDPHAGAEQHEDERKDDVAQPDLGQEAAVEVAGDRQNEGNEAGDGREGSRDDIESLLGARVVDGRELDVVVAVDGEPDAEAEDGEANAEGDERDDEDNEASKAGHLVRAREAPVVRLDLERGQGHQESVPLGLTAREPQWRTDKKRETKDKGRRNMGHGTWDKGQVKRPDK